MTSVWIGRGRRFRARGIEEYPRISYGNWKTCGASSRVPSSWRTIAWWAKRNSACETTILVTNLETLVWFSPSPMLIWVLQSSHCFKIRLAQHCGRRGANVSENEGVRSECKKFGENSRQMAPVSTICDEYCRWGLDCITSVWIRRGRGF